VALLSREPPFFNTIATNGAAAPLQAVHMDGRWDDAEQQW
jgi:hypothetical protein